MSPNYKILYIVGMTHSGSTLLDLLISKNSLAVSVGEVWQLANLANTRYKKDNKTLLGNECTCGAETIWHCSFWPRIDGIVKKASGLSLRDLDLNSDDPETFRLHNKLVFDAVAEVSGARVIIDSSKLQGRLERLVAAGFAPMLPLHLMRDPRGQVCSVIHRAKRPVLRPALRYCRETATTVLFLRGKPHLSVQYENLALDPAGELRRIMEWSGLAYEPAQLAWTDQISHNIDGNVMRRSTSNEIKSDEKWRERLTVGQKIAVSALTLPAVAMARIWERTKGPAIKPLDIAVPTHSKPV
ncbi:hypothetical protein N825_08550 [Skermanella stibiiresistens SB22]|uniref:Sulfotransferase n=1 Tax=Skermanella stibiiresistens SB22 TaxID=1385369 RepID=W9H2V1_9PROT|nr:sulfotransferase [Skermanella stibiiresistens]EWY39042.1 hypothetical protein N825_08550 [Skermanella stibiiresistens SB22]